MSFTTEELAKLTMDTFTAEDEGCAFALGTLAGFWATAAVLEGSATASKAAGMDEAAELLRELAKSFRDTVSQKLGDIQKPKLDS